MKPKKLIVIAPVGTNAKINYLTDLKEYIATKKDSGSFEITDDDGDVIYCLFKNCAHLYGNNWAIK